MADLTTKLPWEKAQPLWASQLNPVLANALMSGNLLENVALANGTTTLHHGLGQIPKGYIVVYQSGAASIYAGPLNNTETLSLTSSAAITANLWVF